MDGHIVGAPVMMQLGSFQFGIATAAYQELNRTSEWRWAEQQRFGQTPALQFTGPAAETITLPGVIYPEWRGGVGQVDAMRALGGKGVPLALVTGTGASLGRWIIERVDERQGVFAAAGVARRVEFTLDLKRFNDDGTAALFAAIGAAFAGSVSIPAAAATPVAKVEGLAQSVGTNAKSLSGTLSRAADQVQAAVAPYAAIARDALGAVNRSLGVVGELQGVANQALSAVGIRPIETNALLHADNLAARANRVLVRAQSASEVLRTSSERLSAIQGATPAATKALVDAQAAADRTVTLTRQTAIQAATIKGQ